MKQNDITLGSSIYERIKKDIIFWRLQPGAKLKLDNLKIIYAVSVSTLRETLNRLSSEGFVLFKAQRGFFVAPISKEDIVEIADLRILLESYALKNSIENGGEEWEASIVAAHYKLSRMENKMLEEGAESQENIKNSSTSLSREKWKRLDSEFHHTLIQACNSKNLLTLHSMIYDKYFRYQMHLLSFRGKEAAEEHEAMMKAALERKVELAQDILKQHIDRGLAKSMTAFEETPKTLLD